MKKNDLFKLSLIFVGIVIVLTWFIGSCYFNSGALVSDEITRVGIFDISTYGFLGIYYFIANFIFVLAVAGFYKLLNNVEAYRVLTDKIANAMKGKVQLFVAAVILLFAVLSSIVTEQLMLLILIPFFISILSKIKVDKVTGVATTFGGIIIGIIGSTYASNIVGVLVSNFNVTYGFEIISQWILLALGFVILTFFVTNRIKKTTVTEENELKDPFETVVKVKKEDKKKKVSIVPMSIILGITLLIAVLGFIGWSSAFGVTLFDELNTSVREAELFGVPLFAYILGSANYAPALGSWTCFNLVGLIIIATLIIKIVYKIPFDKIIESFGEGIKKVGYTVLIMLTIYTVLIISVSFPTIPYFISKINDLFGNNIFTVYLTTFITGLFNIDFQYVVGTLAGAYSNLENISIFALTMQAAYGLASLLAPTSLILAIGLSLNDVKYKDWIKFIWKAALALLVLSIIVIFIVGLV